MTITRKLVHVRTAQTALTVVIDVIVALVCCYGIEYNRTQSILRIREQIDLAGKGGSVQYTPRFTKDTSDFHENMYLRIESHLGYIFYITINIL